MGIRFRERRSNASPHHPSSPLPSQPNLFSPNTLANVSHPSSSLHLSGVAFPAPGTFEWRSTGHRSEKRALHQEDKRLAGDYAAMLLESGLLLLAFTKKHSSLSL